MIKTLVIYPGTDCQQDAGFYIFDPETGECLASHFCSGCWFAKGDLHDNRLERLKEWEAKYGMKTEAKFVEETEYTWTEIYKKNQELKKEVEKK